MIRLFILLVLLITISTGLLTQALAAPFPAQLDSRVRDGVYVGIIEQSDYFGLDILSNPNIGSIPDLNGDGIDEQLVAFRNGGAPFIKDLAEHGNWAQLFPCR